MWHLSFSPWLILFNMIVFSFVHFPTNNILHLLYGWLESLWVLVACIICAFICRLVSGTRSHYSSQTCLDLSALQLGCLKLWDYKFMLLLLDSNKTFLRVINETLPLRHMTEIPVHGRGRQQDNELKADLNYRACARITGKRRHYLK